MLHMGKFNNNDPRRIKLINAAHIALTVTCQLYQRVDEDSEKFTANGCVVLFSHNDTFYCFSNAHVLADHQLGKTFFLLKDGTSVTVGGELFYSLPLNSEHRNDDTLDISIVKLNLPVVEYLIRNGQRFLTIDQILTGFSLSKENRVLIAGYPASKTKIDIKTNNLKFNPLISRTIPYLRKLNNDLFTKDYHHIVEFPIKSFKETSTGQRMRAPQPYGISGSGLWLLLEENGITYIPILIGILSEYHENNAILISTKIDLFIGLLKQKFDSTINYNGIEVELGYE